MVPKKFFNRPADIVARELIECLLCVQTAEGIRKLRITETEAYMGPHDLACHAAKGRTKRTEVMYKKAGTMYVYLVYGMYNMFNVVTGAVEYPAAVLVRGVEGLEGPGKLTKALNITRASNDRPLGKTQGVWVEKPKEKRDSTIVVRPRIGIAYAKEWKETPLRFTVV